MIERKNIHVIRSFTKKAGILYSFNVESIVKDNKECRRLRLEVGSETFWFTADSFIAFYISKNAEKVPEQIGLGSLLHTCNMAMDWGKQLKGDVKQYNGLEFPISIIIQIVLFAVMELLRYWKNKKLYQRIEDKWYNDGQSTYTEYEYCGFKEIE